MQLYIIDLNGGEAQRLTDLRGSVSDPAWLPSGKAITFLYDGTLDAEKAPDPDPIVVDEKPAFNRVWLVDAAGGAPRAITPSNVHIHEYALSRDGRALALVVSSHPNPMQGWYSAQLHTMPVDGGALRQVCTLKHQIGRLTWSPDGDAIALVSGVMSDEGNIAGEVFVVPAAGGEARNITPDIDQSITWIEWRAQGILYCARRIERRVQPDRDFVHRGVERGGRQLCCGARKPYRNAQYPAWLI
jgi:Tol biopolymer transport system component